jgi:hypothetical protein
MNMTLKGGLVLGVLVVVFTLINGFAGLYKNPSLGWVFPVIATVIEIGVLVWALRQTAADKKYWGQVGTGTMIAVVGGVIIIVGSLLFTSLFPDYQEVALANAEDGWRDAGMSQAQIDQQLPVAQAMVKPIPQAILGFVMTILTGFVMSLIIGAFVRRKE